MTKLLRWFRDPSHLLFACLFLAGVGFLLANSLRLWLFTIDDAYITFRYSANAANGIGPTYNAQGPRAEGYTSGLWMAVMIIPHLLRFGEISFAKLVGLLAMVGCMAGVSLFVWQAGRVADRAYRLAAAGLVCLFFGLLPETAIHAVSGMETALSAFLLTLLVLLGYLSLNGSRGARDWLPLAALLVGLARPEANLPAGLALAAVAACIRREERARLLSPQMRRFLLRVGLLYVLPGLAYFLWRWSYFGVLLPLPFYVKTGGGGLPGLGMVSAFSLFALANLGLYLGLGLFGERRAVGLLGLLALPALAFFLFSHPVMEYDYRFFYPMLPLLLALAGLGLELLLAQARAAGGSARSAAWVGLVVIGVFAAQSLPRTAPLIEHKQDYALGMLRNHVAIGQTLAQAPHDGNGPVLALVDAGAMPYFSGWRTIDVTGLNDADVALGRVDVETYIFAQNPEVLVLTSSSLQEYQRDSEFAHLLYRRARENGLEVVARTPFYQGDSIWVLARPGSAAAERLKARFAEEK